MKIDYTHKCIFLIAEDDVDDKAVQLMSKEKLMVRAVIKVGDRYILDIRRE